MTRNRRPSGPPAPRTVARSASGTRVQAVHQGSRAVAPRGSRRAPPPSRGPTARGQRTAASCDAGPADRDRWARVRPATRSCTPCVQARAATGHAFPSGARTDPSIPSRWTPTAPCWTSPTWITSGGGCGSSSGRRGGRPVLDVPEVRMPRLRLRLRLGQVADPDAGGQGCGPPRDAHHGVDVPLLELRPARRVTHHAVVPARS